MCSRRRSGGRKNAADVRTGGGSTRFLIPHRQPHPPQRAGPCVCPTEHLPLRGPRARRASGAPPPAPPPPPGLSGSPRTSLTAPAGLSRRGAAQASAAGPVTGSGARPEIPGRSARSWARRRGGRAAESQNPPRMRGRRAKRSTRATLRDEFGGKTVARQGVGRASDASLLSARLPSFRCRHRSDPTRSFPTYPESRKSQRNFAD